MSELPVEAIRQLREMDMQLALGVLERLYEKLVKERGRGHNAENALNGIFNLDSKKKGQDERRKAMKSGKKGKGGKGSKGPGKPPRGMKTVGAMDGNTFARAYCMAALARTPAELCQSLLPAIASVSRNGGDWQKKLQKSYSKQFSALGLSYSQLSLLRWVLEGFSFDPIKVKRALLALRKKDGEVLVELQHFIHAMNLLDVGLSDQVLESLYVAHGGEDGKINLDTLSKGLNIAAAQNENKNDVSMILSGVDEGENWMDSMKGGSAPAWAMKGMPRLAGSIENEEEAREMKRKKNEPTESEIKAMKNVRKYRSALDGPVSKVSPRVSRAKLKKRSAVIRPANTTRSLFQGSLYPPRATDSMDDFARASVKSGVSLRTANLTLGRARRTQKMENKNNQKTARQGT